MWWGDVVMKRMNKSMTKRRRGDHSTPDGISSQITAFAAFMPCEKLIPNPVSGHTHLWSVSLLLLVPQDSLHPPAAARPPTPLD